MKQRSLSEYSMIEPPSVPESSTACMAMVESTWSTSRLELTASPTSRSASSSLDLLGELRAARLELLHQLHAVDRHRGLAGERGDDRHLPLVERADLVAPERERADDLVVEEHRRSHGGPEAGDPLEVVRP